ncbi:hypothetical protein SynBIOSE41_02703 [Synechococcus sp. BIOS-E4-1]|nr:hypothetical protein SynBIOSE41_02703 [Synechococcus sp. BIOS-E4-1]
MQPYEEKHLPPLVRQITVRCGASAYAKLLTRALCERCSEGRIIRLWLWRGALAEGINLHEPL